MVDLEVIDYQDKIHQIKHVDAILFDLDGTLIDSLDIHIESFQWVLEELGKEVSTYELEPLMGKTPQDIIEEFFPDKSQEELWEAAGKKENYMREVVENVYVYPSIEGLLKVLQDEKIPRVVISSTHRDLVEVLLEKAGLLELVSDIVSGNEIANGKPDPEPFKTGLKKAGVSAGNAVAMGDSIYDLYSATSAGIRFIGLLTGKTGEDDFLESFSTVQQDTYLMNEMVSLSIITKP